MAPHEIATDEDPSVTLFRDFLRIDTSHPDPDYGPCLAFLRGVADDVGLKCSQFETYPGNSMLWMTWEGSQPELPSIMLYCHMDVVPAYPAKWTYPPYAAHKDERGDIYARGAQDMKCLGVQYIEAVRRLEKTGKRFPRTIHIMFGPDEELGGHKGMKLFVKTPEFEALNIGLVLDEAIANPGEEMTVMYGERNTWWLEVKCEGNAGHAFSFIKDNAAEKLRRVIDSFLSFRDDQEKRLEEDTTLSLGEVNGANLTLINGGVLRNVVPSEMVATFDVRVSPGQDPDEMEEMIRQWCNKAGPDVTYSFLQRNVGSRVTSTDPSDKWWSAFSAALKQEGVKYKTEIAPFATDSRYIRQVAGLPAYGFSPINHTPVLLHDHDEYLNENIYLRGIQIYQTLISRLASVPQ